MRLATLLLLLATALIIASCGSEEDPVGPQPDDDVTYTLVTTAEIGAAGGTLSAAGYLLTVPAGAFATDGDIDL